ncbi:MAG TPA: hypothetical protein VG246_12245 [Acidimicrobiales bacterium]|jgi:hypothetical protein|nr:hypothetical protein [Acidimicrobiales bacterium]
MEKENDPDELAGLDMEPEQAIKQILDGDETEGEDVEVNSEDTERG